MQYRRELKRTTDPLQKAVLYNLLGVHLREQSGDAYSALRCHRREITISRKRSSRNVGDTAIAHAFAGLCLSALDAAHPAIREHRRYSCVCMCVCVCVHVCVHVCVYVCMCVCD